MRIVTLVCALALHLVPSMAGELVVAVIRYAEPKSAEALDAALVGENLQEITDADRTLSRQSELTAGTVLFVQTLSVPRGASFALSTRIGNQRADVEGRLGGSQVDVRIALMEGVKAGLRNFEKTIYSGSGGLNGSNPTVIGLRQTKGQQPVILKGVSSVDHYEFTTVVVAQYR
jgi:hypothetical protein